MMINKINIIIFIFFLLLGCRGNELNKDSFAVYWKDTPDYEKQISTFKINARDALLIAREYGRKIGNDVMWPEPLIIIEQYYHFGPRDKHNVPLKGYLVDGMSGQVFHIETDIHLKPKEKFISKDSISIKHSVNRNL